MLRRVAVLALLLPPLGAAAQTTPTAGTMSFTLDGGAAASPLYIGPAACGSSTSQVTMTWTTSFKTTGTTLPPSGSTYSVYVSTSAIDCGATTLSLNALNASAIAASTTTATMTWPTDGSLTAGEVVSAAGLTCTSADTSINVCVRLIGSDAQTVVGTAVGVVKLQTAAPAAPNLTAVDPGDQRLYVTWQAGTTNTVTVDHYVVVATARAPADPTAPTDPNPVHTSPGTIDMSGYELGGLVNGVTYDVTVTAYSKGDVASPASNSLPGTPVPVNDFWEQYVADGGREKGGCETGSGGLLALVGVAAALRRARRRP